MGNLGDERWLSLIHSARDQDPSRHRAFDRNGFHTRFQKCKLLPMVEKYGVFLFKLESRSKLEIPVEVEWKNWQ